eukprot:ANDGO_03621.mRNA.1 hypothetical protein
MNPAVGALLDQAMRTVVIRQLESASLGAMDGKPTSAFLAKHLNELLSKEELRVARETAILESLASLFPQKSLQLGVFIQTQYWVPQNSHQAAAAPTAPSSSPASAGKGRPLCFTESAGLPGPEMEQRTRQQNMMKMTIRSIRENVLCLTDLEALMLDSRKCFHTSWETVLGRFSPVKKEKARQLRLRMEQEDEMLKKVRMLSIGAVIRFQARWRGLVVRRVMAPALRKKRMLGEWIRQRRLHKSHTASERFFFAQQYEIMRSSESLEIKHQEWLRQQAADLEQFQQKMNVEILSAKSLPRFTVLHQIPDPKSRTRLIQVFLNLKTGIWTEEHPRAAEYRNRMLVFDQNQTLQQIAKEEEHEILRDRLDALASELWKAAVTLLCYRQQASWQARAVRTRDPKTESVQPSETDRREQQQQQQEKEEEEEEEEKDSFEAIPTQKQLLAGTI